MITKIPTGLEYIKMIASFGEEISRDSVPYLANHKDDLDVLGTALSIFYITATCHRKCQGGSHVLESLVARAYNLALSAYTLTCRGLYDEALNLVRSIGEIANLLGLFLTNSDATNQWLNSEKNTRIRKFGPAKVRQLLESENSILTFADKDWYSKFCEDYSHVHPGTKPNAYNVHKQGNAGGCFQEEGIKKSIDELVNVCAHIAIIVSKYAELDDLRKILVDMVKNYPTHSEP